MPEDRALPNLKARLTIDTSDAQRAQAAVQQARTGIQGMIADAKTAAESTRAATAAQRAEAAEFAASLSKGGGGGLGATGEQAAGATTKIRGLGAAATSMGDAFGGAVGEATRLGSVLAYGGIAGAAAIGISKLAEFGNQMNDTGLDAKQLAELVGKDGAQALNEFQGALHFGDAAGELKQLTESGAAGVGTILNMRDAALAAGQDTSKFDTALEQFNATFNRTGATVQRGADYIDQLGGSEREAAEETDRLADAARRLESVTNKQASAATSLLTSQSSVVAAHQRVLAAQEKLANFGTQATGKSIREARDEARAVEDASRRIIDAQQGIIDARQRVVDAQEALAHAGEHERLDVQDAQDAVDAAQRKLNASTPEERAPAQHALEDAQQRLADAKEALDQAKPDAERALADAVRGVDDAMRKEADAHRDLADAQDRQAESSQKATDSQGDYQAAVDGVNEALIAQAQAVAHQKDLLAELGGAANGPVLQLGNLKQALRDIADDLDPSSELAQRILYLLASLTQSGAQRLIEIATPGRFKQSARGNHLAAFEPSWVGDKYGMDRAELFVPDVPGTVAPVNPFELAAMGGSRGDDHSQHLEQHNHFYGDVNPSKAAREQRRELERFAMQAAR